ncbi:Variant-specific surface protein [Giardia duodenalis]|uniref:Variant-specific surface protein n=1 Tax=Giardia intestinalis TaxID=5741 RepID=V6TNC4_GIAIN|nr:Variant-specific surface protein [Giardia intestinalis]
MLLAIYLAVGALAIECKTSGNNCFAGQCDTVGGTEICMRCQTGRVPINGVCAEAANNDKCKDTNGSTDADQTCKKCLLETFMYKGGCYEIANSPGSIICSQKGAAGVCQTCNAANGYFTNPEAAAAVDSCISCGDATGVTIGENDNAKTYKGIAGCKTCTISDSATTATCTECATGFLHTSSGSTSCVTTCPKGYFGHTDSNSKKTCQSCSTPTSGLTPSVTGIPGCTSCTYTSSTLKCTACGEGKKPNKEGTRCFDCSISGCAYCSGAGKCEECDGGKIVKTAAGVTSCVTEEGCTGTEGFFVKDGTPKTCVACNENCKTCSGAATACTSCKDTDMIYLKKEADSDTGTCVDANGCTNGNTYYADDTVDPTSGKLCRKCAEGGLKDCATCVKSADDLVCKECTGKKFGLNKKSCVSQCPVNSQAGDDNVCKCNDGFTPNADSSACTQCHSSCLTCSAAGDSKCKSCKDGYFLGVTSGQTGKCISCGDATGSGGWTGVTGCAKCTKPAAPGTVTCDECTTDYLKTESAGTTSCVTADKCGEGFFATTVGSVKKCVSCNDNNNGITDCGECTASGNAEAATCSACQAGYVKDQTNNECKPCGTGCSACSASNQQECIACLEGKYLNGNACVDGTGDTCGQGKYADPTTNECKNCATDIPECTACTYSDSLQKPVCSNCGSGGKLLRIDLDGTTTCVNDAGCADGNTHFVIDESGKKCLLCNDTTTSSTDANKGVDHCKTCTKANTQKPVCSACLDGYYGTTSCTACTGANCATCNDSDPSKCVSCKPGFFLKDASTGECVPCDNVDKGGREGCSACSNNPTFKCADCRANYNPSGEETNLTCTKVCEDKTACGGTAGACGAIVVGGDGSMKYYCSQCRQQ